MLIAIFLILVTSEKKATEKVYHDIGRIKKAFRDSKKPIVIVTGCVAQAEGEILLQKEKYIDAVIGPQSYQNLCDTLIKIEKEQKKLIQLILM